MLENIKHPSDIKKLSIDQLKQLAEEIREVIINTVSKNGGHLASNLGAVELTIALHNVFDCPNDKFVFDVSHQSYTHKLLTGRFDNFSTLRQYKGLSGFTNRKESEYDVLNAGHSGASISAALGIAQANALKGNNDYTVAIIGDGSMTNGMVFEALNNCVNKNLNLVIVINDNEMSISRNIGGLHNYLTELRNSDGYFNFKQSLQKGLSKLPVVGRPVANVLKNGKDFIKGAIVGDNIFEDLGLDYLGPVDGHDVLKLSSVLKQAKSKNRVCVVHVDTKKGKGYSFAQQHPENYHSTGKFDISKGVQPSNTVDFSKHFGDIVCQMANEDEKICAITAAMCDGTGLTRFSKEYKDRFFDVGIAEEHAVTFAGGLAVNGLKPIVALYSTFSQRTYDQLFHDVALQNQHIILALDRSGIIPADGITHQGIFDCSFISSIPNTTIYSPSSFKEMDYCFKRADKDLGLAVVRYPKGLDSTISNDLPYDLKGNFKYSENIKDSEAVIITYGRVSDVVKETIDALKDKYSLSMIKLVKVFPFEVNDIIELIGLNKPVLFVEEGIVSGGIAQQLIAEMAIKGYKGSVRLKGIETFVEHGTVDQLYKEVGFSVEGLTSEVEALLKEK